MDALCINSIRTLSIDAVQQADSGHSGTPISSSPTSVGSTTTQEYRDNVLLPGVTARISVEQASTLGCDRYVGPKGRKIGMHIFGVSAPLKPLRKKFGFLPESLVNVAKELLAKER